MAKVASGSPDDLQAQSDEPTIDFKVWSPDRKGKRAAGPPRIALSPLRNGEAFEGLEAVGWDEGGAGESSASLKTPTLSAVGPPSPSLYRPAQDYVDPLIALAPTPPNLSALAIASSSSKANVSEAKVREVFTKAYLRAASSGDSDLLEWLLAKPSPPNRFTTLPSRLSPRIDSSATPRLADAVASPSADRLLKPGEARKWVDLGARDDDGAPAIVLAAAFGHTEAVRAILDGCGQSVVDWRDAAGWTPLHWASRNGDFTIVSYLLNHGASASTVSYSGSQDGASNSGLSRSGSSSTLASDFSTESGARRARGLRPYDLAGRGKDGDSVRQIISMVEQVHTGSPPSPAGRSANGGSPQRSSSSNRLSQRSQRRLDRALQACRALELDFTRLRLGPDSPVAGASSDSVEADEEDANFDWDHCQPTDMLVISPDDLPAFFDAAITNLDPVRPRAERCVPANAIFLASRYAHSLGPDGLLDDLLLGAFDRIEEALHDNADDVANCAFWLFNCLALLAFLKRDGQLAPATEEYQVHLQDLINEVFVYVIREVERRIDKVLDAALLDYTSLPGFDDLTFEGEGWSLVKALTGKRSRQASARFSLASAFDAPSSPPPRSPSLSPSSSPQPDGRHMSNVASFPSENAIGSPRTVTGLLSATLFILESYEIHPAIIVQAFSQIFYWMACEMFNRVLTRRKYLSRSKAMQIRVNVTAIEDWTRTNRLPIKVFEQPFRPLNHLLQWLQCLSGEQSLDGLITTMRNLGSLNPLQMLKASREYRFEVNESRMGEECRQYLIQMHQDWERRRVEDSHRLAEREQAEKEILGERYSPTWPNSPTPAADEQAEKQAVAAVQAIDVACDDVGTFREYRPPPVAEQSGELLDPRQMLPFALPSSLDALFDLPAGRALGLFASQDATDLPSPTPDTLVPSIPPQFLADFDAARDRHASERTPDTSFGVGLGLALSHRA